jgi:hypothetical protein
MVARQKRGQNCLKRGLRSHSQPPTKMELTDGLVESFNT